MDDPDSTMSSDSDAPDEAHAAPPVEMREVLEGEIVQPRRRPDTDEQAEVSEENTGEARASTHEETAQRENVERGLAQYVFVREDREREVRLTFRDASPNDIAHTFRTAGAHLITLSAERTTGLVSTGEPQPPEVKGTIEESIETIDEPESDDTMPRHKSSRQRSGERAMPKGEVLLHYFYALGETVYTVNIVSPSGVAASIAGTYPLALRSERELMDHMAVVFI